MSEAADIRFHTPALFAGVTGVVDEDACVIRGVSVITGNLIAEGHDLHVDDTTLQQLQSCAKAKGKIPVNLDHGTGVKDLNGYLTAFRMDSNKLRADWHLLRSHDETPKMLERAEVMPDCFGLSVAFKGPPKGVAIGGGKMAARCEKLLSVDCVTRPAANDGLFSAREVDSSKKVMANELDPNAPQAQQAEPTLADVMKAVQEMNGRLDQHEQFLSQLGPQTQEEEDMPTLEELNQLDDKALAQLGLNRAMVEQAIAEIDAEEANAAQTDPNAQTEAGPEGELAGANTSSASSVPGAVGAELSALKKQIIELQKKNQEIELKAKKDAEEVELKAIETKALTIAGQRDKAIELAETFKAENEALRLAVKTGTRPVTAGVDSGLRLFSSNGEGELHQFQVRVKQLKEGGKTEAEAIRFAQKENPGSHADWLQSLQTKKVA